MSTTDAEAALLVKGVKRELINPNTRGAYMHYDGSMTIVNMIDKFKYTVGEPEERLVIIDDRTGGSWYHLETEMRNLLGKWTTVAVELRFDRAEFVRGRFKDHPKFGVLHYDWRTYRTGSWAHTIVLQHTWDVTMGIDYRGSYTPQQAIDDEFRAWENYYCDDVLSTYLMNPQGVVTEVSDLIYDHRQDYAEVAARIHPSPIRKQLPT